ncbi:hypothetical protein CPAR01_08956 [Colletotrichum paranaense]|uniref:Uncharacterized protein n=1 Tax=Colletotrichum paranaense TaxID=1914294 RepID=A0ABQ9SFG7_9PEZI|nr:uncharacterized protein CPAR01_08956 [Colletotrichum paranaense]KAK1535414.1 hypothetical protein CPAR01_08956 [Colletotrichum paranaense]
MDGLWNNGIRVTSFHQNFHCNSRNTTVLVSRLSGQGGERSCCRGQGFIHTFRSSTRSTHHHGLVHYGGHPSWSAGTPYLPGLHPTYSLTNKQKTQTLHTLGRHLLIRPQTLLQSALPRPCFRRQTMDVEEEPGPHRSYGPTAMAATLLITILARTSVSATTFGVNDITFRPGNRMHSLVLRSSLRLLGQAAESRIAVISDYRERSRLLVHPCVHLKCLAAPPLLCGIPHAVYR